MSAPDDQVAEVPAAVRPRWRRDALAALRVLRLAVLVGVVVGVVWWRVAPRVMVEVTADGVALLDPGGKAFIAADGWFAVLAAAAGLVCGVVGVLRWRRDGIGLAVGEAVGGVAGALVAMLVGQWLGRSAVDAGAAVGTVVEASLRVRATGVLLAWPLVALLIVIAVAVSFGLDDPDEDDAPADDAQDLPQDGSPSAAGALSPDAPPPPAPPTSG